MVKKKKVVKKNSVIKSNVAKKGVKKKVTLRKTLKKKSFKRVSTGIKNLDKIIGGGFEKGSTNLVTGGSGSGKSIFAIQFLMEGLKCGEKVLYVAFEEEKNNFYANMLKLGWDLEKYEKSKKFFFLSYTPEKLKAMLDEGGGDIEMVVLGKKVQRVAIDSITTFVMLFEREIEVRAQALALFSILKDWECTSLLVYEHNQLISSTQPHGILESEVDSLIFLYFERLNKERERFLEVYKMRGVKHSTNIFKYDIGKKVGIRISSKHYLGKLNRSKSV